MVIRDNRALHRTRAARRTAVCAGLFLTIAAPAFAATVVTARDDHGTPLAREAVELCMRAGSASADEERVKLIERGLATAEQAVQASESDPKAHFAVFCNLGRKLELEGAGLSSLKQIERLKSEIDRALALAPEFPDALAGKGAMLVRLPKLMGGDGEAGERLIRKAVELAPDNPAVRLELAKALAEKGDEEKALAEARGAIQLARLTQSSNELREASRLAADLGS